jgi:hypothetical protein
VRAESAVPSSRCALFRPIMPRDAASSRRSRAAEAAALAWTSAKRAATARGAQLYCCVPEAVAEAAAPLRARTSRRRLIHAVRRRRVARLAAVRRGLAIARLRRRIALLHRRRVALLLRRVAPLRRVPLLRRIARLRIHCGRTAV